MDRQTVPLPGDLKAFLIKVNQMIEKDAFETKIASDDAIQDHCTSGGRVEEDVDWFGFTYINENTGGLWELGFSSVEIKKLIQSKKPTLALYYCPRQECFNASMWKNDCCPEELAPIEPLKTTDLPKIEIRPSSAADPIKTDLSFELIASPKIADLLTMSESEASAQTQAVDNDDIEVALVDCSPFNSTFQIDIGTSRLSFTLESEDTLSPGAIIHQLARGIQKVLLSPLEFQLHSSEVKGFELNQFHRFVHDEIHRSMECLWKPDWL